MRFVKKILALMLVALLTVGFFEDIRIEAKETTPAVPVISVKAVNNGTGVKVTIKKTKDAEGFEIYATGSAISYSDYKSVNDDAQKIAEVTKNGKAKRTVTIKSLPAGSYKIKVRSYNNKKNETMTYSDFSKEKSVKLKEAANGYASSYDFSKVKQGDVIKFGAYEQDGNFTNGKEAIEWVVLEKTKKQVFVVSKYALDCLPYNKEYTSITWEDCTLRKWLNDKFYANAFNKTEKGMIKTTTVKNLDNVKTGTPGGNDTKDKVFLLSQQEMRNSDYGFAKEYDTYDEKRRCAATAYAIAQGTYADSYHKTAEGESTCGWWLRSPGHEDNTADCISYFGHVSIVGSYVALSYSGVRPALYISLKS